MKCFSLTPVLFMYFKVSDGNNDPILFNPKNTPSCCLRILSISSKTMLLSMILYVLKFVAKLVKYQMQTELDQSQRRAPSSPSATPPLREKGVSTYIGHCSDLYRSSVRPI